MKELMMCALALLVILYVFLAFGSLVLRLMHQKFRLTWAMVLGFFAYFAVFQVLYLPCVMLKASLSFLGVLWLALCLVLGILALIVCRRMWGAAFLAACRRKRRHVWELFLGAFTLLLVGFQIYYMVRYGYNGYDTQYYIGAVSTGVHTDSMFVYNAVTGMKEEELPIRYALSGFYMNWAAWCQALGLTPVLFMRYAVGALCALLANSILYELGRLFFSRKKAENGCWIVIIAIGLNFFFRTMYTTSEFLLLRSYEAKAYCANVVLPALFLACMWIWKKRDRRKWWIYLGILTSASATISMSALTTAPAMVGALLAGRALVCKGHRRIGSLALCLLPCALYLLVYFLAVNGSFRIGV